MTERDLCKAGSKFKNQCNPSTYQQTKGENTHDCIK